MANTFISGFAEGANTGLRLRDYEHNRRREDRRDSMAEQAFATQQRNANLQYEAAQEARANQRGLRDFQQIEMAASTGQWTPQAKEAYNRHFRHYGDNIDVAEADNQEIRRAVSTGEPSESTLTALNRQYAPIINQGGPANTYKEIVDAWPTPEGVAFDLEMTRPDGTKYRAPMTTPNRDETDTQVMVVPWDPLFKDIKEKQALINWARTGRVGMGDTAPLEELRAAEAAQAQRQQGLEDFMFKEDYKRRNGGGESPWSITSLGDGRFVMFNKQTGERRLPTAEELQTLGGAGGKVQTVTFTDDMGNKVPMERGPDGSWTPIRPEGEQDQTGIGPGGMTWVQAEERAKQEAGGFLGFGRDEEAVTRRAQELYQGGAQGAPPAVGLQIEQPPAAAQPRAAQQQPAAQPQQVDQATIQRAMGNPDAMREVLRQLNPGASPQEIEAGVAAALQNQPAGASGVIQR